MKMADRKTTCYKKAQTRLNDYTALCKREYFEMSFWLQLYKYDRARTRRLHGIILETIDIKAILI